MEASVQLEEKVSQYTMKVCSTLLTMAYVHNVDPDDLVEFFATQVQAMLTVQPNYKMYGNTPPVWVMRGFYPGTCLFFKLTVAKNERGTWAKATIPIAQMGCKRRVNKVLTWTGTQLNDALVSKMENSLLGANHEIKQLVGDKGIRRMPRCMSPKGIRVFTCDVKRAKKDIPDTKTQMDNSNL